MAASSLTIAAICGAINTELGEALVASGDLLKSLNYDQLEEGINDPRTLQVYPEEQSPVSIGSQTQKLTLGNSTVTGAIADTPYIEEEIIIHADYYARQRSNIGEDMAELVAGIDAIRANLKTQNCPNPFDLDDVATFQWSWRRVIFDYGEPELKYIGARFRLVLRVF